MISIHPCLKMELKYAIPFKIYADPFNLSIIFSVFPNGRVPFRWFEFPMF